MSHVLNSYLLTYLLKHKPVKVQHWNELNERHSLQPETDHLQHSPTSQH